MKWKASLTKDTPEHRGANFDMTTEHTLVVFPIYIGNLGGAEHVRIGVRYVWVTVQYGQIFQTYRVPKSQFKPGELDCGFKSANRARVWFANRNKIS